LVLGLHHLLDILVAIEVLLSLCSIGQNLVVTARDVSKRSL
jgi:hypothetical protein